MGTRLRQRLGTSNQMEIVAVGIAEKDQPVALDFGWLGEKFNAALTQLLNSGVEVVYGNGQVANAWIFHLLRRAIPFRRNDLEQRAVAGAHEVIAAVGVIDTKLEILHVPFRQPLGIGRCDGGVLQSLKHKPGLYQSRIGGPACYSSARRLEQLGGELVQILAPVGPGVGAGAFLELRIEAVHFE